MYFNDYDEYMKSVLGYNNKNNMNLYSEDYSENYYSTPTYQVAYRNNENIESLFPDIYKTINPMVTRMVNNTNEPITKDLVERMTSEIYDSLIANDVNLININIETVDSNFQTKDNEKQLQNRDLKKQPIEARSIQEEKRESRGTCTKCNNNPLLRDLIKILLLNGLSGRRPIPRPPYPGPNFPGRPPRPRPPFPGIEPMPRPGNRDYEYNDYWNY